MNWVDRLRRHEGHLPEILELGLRELNAEAQRGFDVATEVLEFLASLPSPQEILNLKPSEGLQYRVHELLAKSRVGTLTPREEQDWERYEFLEHLVRISKTEPDSNSASKTTLMPDIGAALRAEVRSRAGGDASIA